MKQDYYVAVQTESGLYLRRNGPKGLSLVDKAPRLYNTASSAKRAISNYRYHKDFTEFVIKKVTLEVENVENRNC